MEEDFGQGGAGLDCLGASPRNIVPIYDRDVFLNSLRGVQFYADATSPFPNNQSHSMPVTGLQVITNDSGRCSRKHKSEWQQCLSCVWRDYAGMMR